jgi:ferredoxin
MRGKPLRLERTHLDGLIHTLKEKGYEVLGPRLEGPAIRWRPISAAGDLPEGITAELAPGRYRAAPSGHPESFRHWTGPDTLKRFLHPPEARIGAAVRDNGTFRVLPEPLPATRYAFFGVRPCDLAALRILDRVLMGDRYADESYRALREQCFLVAANCTASGAACFCASMAAGPRATGGFDIVLTEVVEDGAAAYLAEAGAPRGAALLAGLNATPAAPQWVKHCHALCDGAAREQTRPVDWRAAREVADRAFDHPRWDRAAARCLACGNCTMACPTCFCVNAEDSSNLAFDRSERRRIWDSCFNQQFSFIHGGSVRLSVKSRYRHWLTHKLARWQDQFGSPGCTGCGRCIVWCPADIDITEEFAALAGGAQGADQP